MNDGNGVGRKEYSLPESLQIYSYYCRNIEQQECHPIGNILGMGVIQFCDYRKTQIMNRCSKPSAVYSTIDCSKLHETASAA